MTKVYKYSILMRLKPGNGLGSKTKRSLKKEKNDQCIWFDDSGLGSGNGCSGSAEPDSQKPPRKAVWT